ncbi:MAG: hypothetical protein LUQ50_03945 [Methanospirillum sp.]|uniref:hypothetical protein n=1 Tax=Methanospirillum sp. TaxID=45200 RepID=UPI002371809A|nr:hypothetical protein [Methanospirillum sp.]MDD1728207.1 hypothetical protein [Methanospirillum sp.]
MILEVITGISCGTAILNGAGMYLLYRKYRFLAEESLEFAGMVISSLKENEEGTITMDPVSLAGVSMDHMSRLGGIVSWMRG